MTTNPGKMPRHTQFLITGLGALVLALLAVFVFTAEDGFVYIVTRLTFSLIGFVACAMILRQSVSRVRQLSSSPEQRLRMVTIVLLLTEISALLAVGALVAWNDPPPTNSWTAIIGVMIRASLAYGATIIAVTNAQDEAEIRLPRRQYAEFLAWKKTNDDAK